MAGMNLLETSTEVMAEGSVRAWPTKPRSPTEAHLQELAATFLDIVFNQRNYEHPWLAKHLAPDFENTCEIDFGGRVSRTLFTHFQRWGQILEEQPRFSIEMVDIMPDVDKSGLKARNWCRKQVKGYNNGSKRDSVCEQFWELREEVWVCVEMRSLTSGFAL